MTHESRPTTRPWVPMDQYLREISGDALLSAAEERALAQARARGDEEARARLIRANLRLVVRIARDYQGRGLSMDDLVGEGNLGLIRAVEDFDPAFGVRFGTYAAHWIKQAIREALSQTAATIRLPSHMVGLLGKWRRAEQALARRLGRDPLFDEVAEALALSEPQKDLVRRAQKARRVVSEAAEPGSEGLRLDFEAADPARPVDLDLEADEQIQALKARLGRLEERERAVLTLRFGLDGLPPLTLREAGDRLGCTREWVRKIERRALDKLQDPAPEAPPATRLRRPTPAARTA